ncbi:MAG: beta-N-acetylhexosaminidase [Anaerolineae bacterium]|nr:beta-N-acetylhexosaminidase [Anaerolineae bacterium]
MTPPQSVADKIGQMVCVGFAGLQAPDYLLDWLRDGRAGGVILFARNVESPEQLARLTEALHAAAKYPLLVSIDQEGGTVARLRGGFTESPGALALASAVEDRVGRVERMSRVLGEEMRALGINWVYAPAVDLLHHLGNPTLGTRSFGIDAGDVSALAAAAVRGFQSAGVAACVKHFPGLGNTVVDTHVALPMLTISEAELVGRDLLPYRAAIDAGVASIMTTHTIFSSLDTVYPATLSPHIIQRLVRETLGFQGVVTSDCMEMKAIAAHHSPAHSALLAAQAGVELILFSHTPAMQEAAYDALLSAAIDGRLSSSIIERAGARIAAMKDRYAVTNPPDLNAIRTADHLASAEEAARAGIVSLYGEVPPLQADHTLLVEFASYLESGIVESGGQTGLVQRFTARLPGLRTVTLPSSDADPAHVAHVFDALNASDMLILATRNAGWNPEQAELAGALIHQSARTVLLCLRTPYDAQILPRAAAALTSCGDSAPSLDAILDALTGEFTPTGRLPFPAAL